MQNHNSKLYTTNSLYFLGIILFCLFLIFSPLAADAHVGIGTPLVPCDGTPANPCNVCSLYTLAHNVIDFLLWGLATPLLVIAILVGGIYWLISGGSEQKIERGKEILTSAIIGFLIAFGAWIIINTIMDTLAFKTPFKGTAWSDTSFCANSPFVTDGTGITPPPPSTTPGTPPPPVTQQRCPTCTNLGNFPVKPGSCKASAQGQTCQVDSELNTKLTGLNASIIKDGKTSYWQVTETWPPTVNHKNSCHNDGTCVDANLLGSARGSTNDIKYFIQKSEAAGLRPVYEVQNDVRKDQLLKAGVPSGKVITVPGINAEHFSVYKN